ncbi:LANO_0G12068g1_1 [Lachancea nothofagi CBS 11611]|uniref:LANO_0G12068g1_1 n=1 Tax=Lachancea nothofagi CBS 11611 TaxID=1266666 RepID=A0A1G4KJU0_9SACH|nr:LANO_0G12068g1_1 [Lachancea nothofagi CBS 11611]
MTVPKLSVEELFISLRDIDSDGSETFENLTTKINTDDKTKTIDREEVVERFLQPSSTLPWSLLDLFQTVPEMNFMGENVDTEAADYDYKEFLQIPELIKRTSYHFKRRGIDGKIDTYHESVNLEEVTNANASNSLSISRKIDTEGNNVRGSSSQLPFTPGGLTMTAFGQSPDVSAMTSATKLLHRDAQGLFDIPQGLDRGIIPQEIKHSDSSQIEELNELNEIDNEFENLQELTDSRQKEEDILEKDASEQILANKQPENPDTAIDDLLPISIDFGRTLRKTKDDLGRKEWAHVVDLNHRIDNFDELVPNPARTWPFELDVFQKEAVYHLEQGDSVFVAAHTSAGKTVVAEYAIAMAKRNMTKTIYTSPIKALSNQKFRDFKEDLEGVDVGLITGDVQINPEANCLIMTTEILRSMLYRGADLIRDVEFVIFDEVHYVNDQDRGVVWEEVIIMLPQHVKFILLSATVPNTYEFANWIGRTKQKNIYVISTPKRPVPLEINIWAKEKLLPVISEKREFLESNFKAHKELVAGKNAAPGKREVPNSGRGRGGATRGGGSTRGGQGRGGSRGAGAVGSNRSDFFKRSGPNKKTWSNLVNFLKSKDLLPAVIFVFSKKRCEDYADWLDGINFCTGKERSQIHMFIDKSVTRLKKEDRDLPQIVKVKSLLERGIAVHHGGLLPIVKELIELLFAKGLIRVLFATETFAMGLNLPTRTVVFSEIQKHDGNNLRNLNPGEFTQMAGRAGRRGLDKTGTVIVMAYTSPLEQTSFKEVALGVPTKLQSQFRLTYNMILNLLRIEALRVEEMIKYSFSENSKQTLLPEHENKIKALQSQLDSIQFYDDSNQEELEKVLDAAIRYKECTKEMMSELVNGSSVFRVLNVGRLILFRDENDCAKLGFVFRNLPKEGQVVVMTVTKPNKLENGQPNHLPYLSSIPDFVKNNFRPFQKTDFYMENIMTENVEMVSAFTLDVAMTDVMKQEPEVLEKFNNEVSLILRIAKKLKETQYEKKGSLKIHQAVLEREKIKSELASFDCFKSPNFAIHFLPKYKEFEIQREIKDLYHLMSDQNLSLLPDYEQRLSVLKDAGFIDQGHNVLLKGRVACEINSGYELVLTELILDNFLGDFEPEEIVALLSVFVYEGRTREEEPPITTPRLTKGKARIQEIYKTMLDVYEKHQVPLTKEEAEFLEKKRFALMNVVYEWARGLSFKEIMEMSVEAEGTIVRVITRLDEICREVKTASIIIGNSTLHMKMSQAQELIKRDIVFAASLYL